MSISKLFTEGLLIYENIYVVITIAIYSVIATYTDIRYGKIYNKLNLFFLIIRLALISVIPLTSYTFFGFLLGLIITWVPAIIFYRQSGGDIKMAAILGLYLGIASPLFFAITVVFGVGIGMYMFYIKNRISIPFAVAFLLAHITTIMLSAIF